MIRPGSELKVVDRTDIHHSSLVQNHLAMYETRVLLRTDSACHPLVTLQIQSLLLFQPVLRTLLLKSMELLNENVAKRNGLKVLP